MKPELEIVNVVGSGEIPIEALELDAIASDVSADIKDNEGSGTYFIFENGNVTLYGSGKYIILAGSEEQVHDTHEELLDEFNRLEIIDSEDEIEFELYNFVGYGRLNRSLNLIKLAIAFGLEKTDYEPEQFPALIYRDYPVAVLIYENGKVVLPGGPSRELIEETFQKLIEDIKQYSDEIGL
jgi:transcription initiation factor TFIID TATA-box-binding protein